MDQETEAAVTSAIVDLEDEAAAIQRLLALVDNWPQEDAPGQPDVSENC